METNLQNAVVICAVGFGAVMVFLSGYALVIAALNKLNTIISERKSKVSSNSKSLETQIDEDTIAIIAAAVTASIGENVIIKKIAFVQPMSPDTAWSNMYKTTNFQSRNINIQKRREYNAK
jgi:Na+-transporting methylmalonyl-CoA/oxaloacetate decarboxylase gamma subunit